MENNTKDINKLVYYLAYLSMKPILDDGVWQCYGYKKRPKHGSYWDKIFPKMFELQNFISIEILKMGLIDVLNGVKKSTKTIDIKLLISIGIIDQFLSTTKHMFSTSIFMDDFFSSYTAHLKCEKSKIHEPVILKSKNVLNKRNFAKFMIGTIKLIAIENTDDFLLNSDYIKDFIEKSSQEDKLQISMPSEMCEKYIRQIEEIVFNKL